MTTIEKLYPAIRGHRITTDSRQIIRGDIFIALKGENFDGNRYAAAALEQGAALAIIDNADYLSPGCELVADSLLFLQQLAHYHRQQLHIPILGITGTNGKTTTKELCHAVLSKKFKTFATQGNFNNHIGVPLTLLSMDETTEFGIVEMGANHPGEIKTLCEIADPDFGIITNIGHAHLEGFGSYENIIATKKALYDYLLPKNGPVFVNTGDPLLMQLSRDHKRYTYGQEGDLLKGEIKQTVPYLVYSLKTRKGDLYVKTHLVGGYNFDNAMAASAIGMHFGIDPLDIQTAIENYRPSNLRSQLIRSGRNTIILDAYNANPSSMQASLANFLGEESVGGKVAVLGDMLELGAWSAAEHRAAVEQALAGDVEQLWLVGTEFSAAWRAMGCGDERVRLFATCDEAAAALQASPFAGKFVLLKGSHGIGLERLIEWL